MKQSFGIGDRPGRVRGPSGDGGRGQGSLPDCFRPVGQFLTQIPLTSSSAAAKMQTANCTFDGIKNQTIGTPTTLVPFQLLNGTAVTPGTTTITINCTG